jgi:hypothetical protein
MEELELLEIEVLMALPEPLERAVPQAKLVLLETKDDLVQLELLELQDQLVEMVPLEPQEEMVKLEQLDKSELLELMAALEPLVSMAERVPLAYKDRKVLMGRPAQLVKSVPPAWQAELELLDPVVRLDAQDLLEQVEHLVVLGPLELLVRGAQLAPPDKRVALVKLEPLESRVFKEELELLDLLELLAALAQPVQLELLVQMEKMVLMVLIHLQ